MHTYPIADFLIRIKNGYMAGKDNVSVPRSKVIGELAKILARNGYVGKVEIKRINKVKADIIVKLIYQNKKPKLTEVEVVSKPGRRIYVGKNEIPKVLGGLGIAIISTPKGLMTGKQARKSGFGGEILCKMW